MALHTVESLVGAHDRHFQKLVDIPAGTTNKDSYCRHILHLEKLCNTLAINECELGKDVFHPRMARPYHIHNSYIGGRSTGPLYINGENMAFTLPHDSEALGNSVAQLAILVKAIKKILEYIQPVAANFSCYSHQTRNVLLLASMDFENECRGVLEAHNYPGSRLCTADYVKLDVPLRLKEYKVKLTHYPQLPLFSPFDTWNVAAPTQSLSWYDNYNSVKHAREANFHKSTLISCLNAVCAVAIMLAAQYRTIASWEDQIGRFFLFTQHPKWEVWRYYIPPSSWAAWLPVALSL